jgi:hypothetical protein
MHSLPSHTVGAVGNIGQRDAGVVGGELLLMQEGNTGHMPPTIWADWKLWLYTPTQVTLTLTLTNPTFYPMVWLYTCAQGESFPPAGNPGAISGTLTFASWVLTMDSATPTTDGVTGRGLPAHWQRYHHRTQPSH